jgi:long-chain acyl-CoA synthetase
VTTLIDDLSQTVKEFGNRVALKYYEREITYNQLDLLSNGVARQLSEFATSGDTIILCTQNIPQFPVVEYAAWKLGLVVLPVNPSYTSREFTYVLQDSKAKVAVAQCESRPSIEAAARSLGSSLHVIPTNSHTFFNVPERYAKKWGFVDGEEALDLIPLSSTPYLNDKGVKAPLSEDPALLVYTSGTTGEPKGAVIRHRNIHAGADIYKRWFRFTQFDRILGLAPFFHVTGLVFHLAAVILSGACVVFTGRFDPLLATEEVHQHQTTLTMLAATAYLSILNLPDHEKFDFSSMRLWSSGGMAVPRQLEEDWKRLTGDWIYVAWGMTETSSPATLWPYPYSGPLPVDPETGVVSAGTPVFDTKVKVVDDEGRELPEGQTGELCVMGPQVIDTYLNKPEATAKSFLGTWLLTGDLAKIYNGWVFVIDRKKDIINSSGFKIWPREVEEVLFAHPAVSEAAVVGVPDSYRGETVKAYISLKYGWTPSETLKGDIVEHCRKRLAPYKVPRNIEFVNEIPKTLSGKLLRRVFREPSLTGEQE